MSCQRLNTITNEMETRQETGPMKVR
jgi:hypothetical protein